MYMLSKSNDVQIPNYWPANSPRKYRGRYQKNPLPLIGSLTGAISGISKVTLPTIGSTAKAAGTGLKLPTLPKIQLPKIDLFGKKKKKEEVYVPGAGAKKIEYLRKRGYPIPDNIVDLKTLKQSKWWDTWKEFEAKGMTPEEAIERMKEINRDMPKDPEAQKDFVDIKKQYQEVREKQGDLATIKKLFEDGRITEEQARTLANTRIGDVNKAMAEVDKIAKKTAMRKELKQKVHEAIKKSFIPLI